jgi:uncharacterized protein
MSTIATNRALTSSEPLMLRPEPYGEVCTGRKIWVDLENSPHVPFFRPIIHELGRLGIEVFVTVRDCAQTRELADYFGMPYRLIGRHYGKNKIAKAMGLGLRMCQLTPTIRREKPVLALSHGSRSSTILSSILGVPSITIFDYEFVNQTTFSSLDWVMIPEVLPDKVVDVRRDRILRYPGIKEDVYVPFFKPDPTAMNQLGISGEDTVITVRPPAINAHYHNPESERLLTAAIEFICQHTDVKIVLLPRYPEQATALRKSWSALFASGKMLIPEHVVDGLNLIWHSDLVISGGGTMNREAAALRVPVYSIFRGKIGAVDQYLSNCGRLVLLENVEQIAKRVIIARRARPAKPQRATSATLQIVVGHILKVLELTSKSLN